MSSANNRRTASEYYVTSENYHPDDITVADSSALKRTVAGTAVGNFTEWFDFGVFSFLVPIVSEVFFPAASGWAKVFTFASLATSFLVRPVGGIIWGALGDRIGRKKVLAYTVILMAFGTFALGLLPGYAAIGIGAPILLFTIRGVQGFSTGGEYISAMTFLVEHSPDRRRGHLCSFLPVGTLSGYILGASLVLLLEVLFSHEVMVSWGWRIPFLLAGPFGLIGLYVRIRLEESPVYEKEPQDASMRNKGGWQQLKATVADQWRPILVCMGLVLSFNVTNYMLAAYTPTYLHEQLGVPENTALLMMILVLIVLLVIVSFLGLYSDRVGRKPIMYAACIMLIVVSVPMFRLMAHGTQAAVFFGTLPMGLILVCFMSTEPSALPTLFPTNVRSGATAIGYNISVSAFGGTTPLIAAALVTGTGNQMWPAYILIIAGIIGIVSVYFMPEPVGRALPGSGPIVESKKDALALAAVFRARRDRVEGAAV